MSTLPIVVNVVVQILFGINFLTSKIVLKSVAPSTWAYMRFVGVAILMWLYLLLRRHKFPRFNVRLIVIGFFMGLVSVTCTQWLFTKGLTRSTVSNASVLGVLTPIFTFILLRPSFSWKSIIPLLCGAAGVILLQFDKNFDFSMATFIGDIQLILGYFLGAVSIIWAKDLMDEIGSVDYTFMVVYMGAIQLASANWFLGKLEFDVMLFTQQQFLAAFIFCLIGGTFLPYLMNMWALSKMPAQSFALFIYLQPLVASFLGYIFFHEVLGVTFYAGAGLIAFGLLFELKKT